MIPFAAALAAILVLTGVMVVVIGMIPHEVVVRPPGRMRKLGASLATSANDGSRKARRRKTMLLAGLVAGFIAALLSGWLVLIVIIPAAVIGIPILLATNQNTTSVARLEAMEEWTRALAGVLTVGVGLEQAITATMRSAPEAIRPEVTTLVARLRARWGTVPALRAFADDLDDATGDLIASSLILGATRRGAGLASVLEGLAATVAQDVQVRRKIEADRAKPRTTARIVTIITLAMLGFISFNANYIAPYGTAIGQIVLVILLSLYVVSLMWMRQITKSKPLPRIMGRHLRAAHRASPTSLEGTAA